MKEKKRKIKNGLFMAFGKASETTEVQIKRYIGVAPVFVLAVNPTKEELSELYGRDIQKVPEYTGMSELTVLGEKKQVQFARINFVVATDPAKCDGIDMRTTISFVLRNGVQYTKDNQKVQVINKYGETAYLTIEEFKQNIIPERLSWFSPDGCRAALMGEADLVNFIKKYLGIPNRTYKKDGETSIEIENLEDAEARLDRMQDYFKGDVSELKELISLLPNNKIKVLFGVRSYNGSMYQDVYTREFLKNSITNYSFLDAHMQNSKNYNMYPNTEFEVCNLKEYKVEATTFSKSEDTPAEANPSWFVD